MGATPTAFILSAVGLVRRKSPKQSGAGLLMSGVMIGLYLILLLRLK